MTKSLTLLGVAAALLCSASAFAQDAARNTTEASGFPGEFTANVALTSDYTFRGISQSDEGPAIQGGFDYSYLMDGGMPGVYAGVWASNVDFNDGDEADVEIDLYAGINGSISEISTDWKLGGIYYAYPGAESDLDYDYWEIAALLTHDFGPLVATATFNYSPDYFGSTGDAYYPALALTVPLPYDFSLNAHAGYQSIEDTENYWDWSAGVSYAWNGFNLAVNYIDTDLDEPEECLDGCSERVVFTVSRAF